MPDLTLSSAMDSFLAETPSDAQKGIIRNLTEGAPFDAGIVSSGSIELSRANGDLQKLLIGAGPEGVYFTSPTNGSEGQTLLTRITTDSSNYLLILDPAILIPSDSLITFPKQLLLEKTYIVKLYHNGITWELVALIGGY